MTLDAQDDLARYARVIEAALARAGRFAPSVETDARVQVERGLLFPQCVIDPGFPADSIYVDRLIELSASGTLAAVSVVDRAGHRRPAYRGLLLYAWLQARRLECGTGPPEEALRGEHALRAWCGALCAGVDEMPDDAGGTLPAAQGGAVTGAAWAALALCLAGRSFAESAWAEAGRVTFARIIRSQTAAGGFLKAGRSDNPETLWYHELVLLHAVSSYRVETGDPAASAGAARAAAYHLRETQPDHATGQPWGLFAFLRDPATRPLADQMLHALSTGSGGAPGDAGASGPDGVSFILLADALYCLRRLRPAFA